MSLAQSKVTIRLPEAIVKVAITSGSGDYTLSEIPSKGSVKGIVKASLANGKLALEGQKVGVSSVKVYDNKSKTEATVEVQVTAALALKDSKLTVLVSKTEFMEITSGSGSYSAKSDNETFAIASVENGRVKVQGIAKGQCAVTVTDTKTSETASLSVTVEEKGEKIAFDWVDIPAGQFKMGGAESENGDIWERPIHDVKISAFRMSRTEVTFDQYDKFCEETSRKKADDYYGRGSMPVINVSYEDAIAFCEWAGVRLPTEAEWEYACRGKTETKYWFGDAIDDTKCNYSHKVGKTSEVGKYPENPFHLKDMQGNVREWCSDWYSPTYYTDCSKGGVVPTDPQGPATGTQRVCRGGAWNRNGIKCRSAFRDKRAPNKGDMNLGFRVVAK